jgi:hypothetical protein
MRNGPTGDATNGTAATATKPPPKPNFETFSGKKSYICSRENATHCGSTLAITFCQLSFRLFVLEIEPNLALNRTGRAPLLFLAFDLLCYGHNLLLILGVHCPCLPRSLGNGRSREITELLILHFHIFEGGMKCVARNRELSFGFMHQTFEFHGFLLYNCGCFSMHSKHPQAKFQTFALVMPMYEVLICFVDILEYVGELLETIAQGRGASLAVILPNQFAIVLELPKLVLQRLKRVGKRRKWNVAAHFCLEG